MAEEKDLGGRPPMFETPEDLDAKVDEYFIVIAEYKSPPTITGLCYHLGFESRQSFYDYEKKDGFTYSVKRARLRIENIYESNLHGNSNAGSIFALKNMGWTDKQEIDHTTQGEKMVFGGVQIIKPDEAIHPPAE